MVDDPLVIWEDVISWGITELKGKSLKVSLCKLAIGAVVYNILKLLNDLKQGNVLHTEDQILKRIDWEIRTKIKGVANTLNFSSNLLASSKNLCLMPLCVADGVSNCK